LLIVILSCRYTVIDRSEKRINAILTNLQHRSRPAQLLRSARIVQHMILRNYSARSAEYIEWLWDRRSTIGRSAQLPNKSGHVKRTGRVDPRQTAL
jgi:hypothetical protein